MKRPTRPTRHSFCRPPFLSAMVFPSPLSRVRSFLAKTTGMLSFPMISATLTHTFLYYRKQIWTQARRSITEQADIHARLMSKYPQVPEWWYAIIFCKSWMNFVLLLSHCCRSVHVRVWYHQYPTLACTILHIGVCAFTHH